MSDFSNPKLTPWGYIADCETIADFITVNDFVSFTGGKFSASDTRIAANIPSATQAIRNYCGWHIAPSLVCGIFCRVADLRNVIVGRDLLIQIPANFVSSVSKVVINASLDPDTGDYIGDLMTDYDITPGGLLRVYDVNRVDRKSKVFVKYTAGLSGDDIPAIKELTADLVTHSVTSPYGVNSEAVGGVSVSYNATWAGQSSTGLTNNTREVLEPYKLRGVF